MGADKAALKVAVDDARGLRGGVALVDGPGAHFLDACGEVGLQAQQLVARADEAVQAGLFLPQFLQKFGAIFVAHFCQFCFDFGANGYHGRITVRLGKILEAIQQGIVVKAVFRNIANKHGGLGGDEAQRFEQGFLFGRQIKNAHGLAFEQTFLHHFQHLERGGCFFVMAGFGSLGVALHGFFNRAQVGQTQFGLDDFDVGDGINRAGYVHDVGVFKAAHDIDDGIGFANVCKKLVAQTLAFARASHQTGDIDKFDDGRQHALGLDDFGQGRQARVGHFDHAHIGFDGAERVVLGGDTGFGEGVEQGGFAHIGQTHDSAFQAHCFPLCCS